MEALLARPSRSHSTVVWIQGRRGTGKTYLALAFSRIAQGRGIPVHSLSGSLTEPARSAVIDQLGEALGVSSAGTSLRTSIQNVRAAIERSSQHTPMVLLLDAVDLMDEAGLGLVEDLLRRPPVGSAILVFASRVAPHPSAVRGELDRLANSVASERISLGNLTRAESMALLESWFDEERVTVEFADAAHELTGGNPFYLSNLRDYLSALTSGERQARLGGAVELTLEALPEYVRTNASAALDGLTDESMLCLRALAAWGAPLSLGQLQRLTQRTTDEVIALLDPLTETGLVTVDYTKPTAMISIEDAIIAQVVHHGSPLGVRRALHRRCAELLEQELTLDPRGALSVAKHYVQGELPLDSSRAARLLESARRLVEEGRYHGARRLLDHLLIHRDAAGLRDLHANALPLLGKVYAKVGERTRVRDIMALASAIQEGMTPGSRAEIVRWLARLLTDSGRDQDAHDLLSKELEHGELLGTGERAILERDTALCAFDAGLTDTAVTLASDSIERAGRANLPNVQSATLTSLSSIHWRMAESELGLAAGRQAHAVASRAGLVRARARASTNIGVARLDCGDPRKARQWLLRAGRIARANGDVAGQSTATNLLAHAETELGIWDAALESLRRAETLDYALFRQRHARLTRTLAADLLARRGSDAARRIMSRTAADLNADGWANEAGVDVSALNTLALSSIEEAAGNDVGALQLLLDLHTHITTRAERRRALSLEVLPRIALIAARMSERDVVRNAGRCMESLLREVPENRILQVETDHVSALGRIAAREWAPAADLAASAADQFDAMGFKWRGARARFTLGEALRYLGDVEVAANHLRTAHAAFADMGARLEVERAAEALESINKRPRRASTNMPGGLTAREMEIASLAARGLSNAEIADSLSVSVRTVTTHMHRTLAKAGLRSRLQLEEWLALHVRG